MSRDESLYLADIQESCEKVMRFTKGMTYKDFVHDDLREHRKQELKKSHHQRQKEHLDENRALAF